MFDISLSYPSWYFILCILLGMVFSALLYWKDRVFNETPKWIVLLMSFLRFGVISLAAFLLLKPLIKTENQTIEKPIIVIAQDNSQSIIINKDSSFYKNEYPSSLNNLIAKLSKDYEVKTYSFGEQISDSISYDFNQKQTDYTQLLDEIYATYYGRNLGALVIASDGIYNKGQHPLYATKSFKNTSVYTIALGDTTVRKDLSIDDVAHNKLAYLGNDFPMEVVVKSNYFNGKSAIINITKGTKIIKTKTLNFKSDAEIVTIPFKIEAKKAGKQRYSISIQELEGELTYANNHQDVFIEILDNKQEILILSSAPHPDIAALRSAITHNINYQVTVSAAQDFKGTIKEYNLVLFHQIPSLNGNDLKWVKAATKAKIPMLFVLGSSTNYAQFNALKSGLTIVGPRGTTDAKPSLNASFNPFVVEDNMKTLFSDLPPLQIPFASSYQTSNSFLPLLYQKIGSATTDYPLIGFNEKDGQKIGFIVGEGIWRWKFQDHVKNNSDIVFKELISKWVQYLALKEDKNKFRVSNKGEFLENESVIFQAELYNEILELINESDVLLTITNENGEEYPQKSFSKTGDSYRLDAGKLPPGNYTYKASTSFDSQAYSINGEFVIRALKIEFTNVVANHNLLYNLANENAGQMFYPSQLDELFNAIHKSGNIASISYVQEEQTDIIKWKWIFGILILLLAIEWFIRKRNGGY